MLFKTIIAGLMALGLATSATADERGTREEAMAMSHAAKALILSEGKDAAIAAIEDPSDGRFHDHDLYVYFLTIDHIYLAHGAKPALKGKDASGLRDPNGVEITKEMGELLRTQGEGWVDYQWPNPASGKLEKKSGYVEMVGDDMYVGVGVYRD